MALADAVENYAHGSSWHQHFVVFFCDLVLDNLTHSIITLALR